MKQEKQVPPDVWETIVANVPIVSVDLITFYNGGLVMGRRRNEPAMDEWFVPGGRVMKNERLREAIHRISQEELGTTISVEGCLGTYEHMYETSELENVDSKHYVANAYVCTAKNREFVTDSQHSEIKIFHELPKNLHKYVRDYLKDLKNKPKYKYKILENFQE